jgi:hypothetical protein
MQIAIKYERRKGINLLPAPIDLPQRAIVEVFPSSRKYWMTAAKSSFSKAPSETYLPPEWPTGI